jgi:hypothetical protein
LERHRETEASPSAGGGLRDPVPEEAAMAERHQQMVRDGLFAGVIAHVVVAGFFILWNVASGLPALYTAALLGEALFGGLRDPASLTMDTGLAIAFNGVQLLLLLAFGFFAAWLVYETELHPQAWYLAAFGFLAATVAGYAGLLVVTLLIGGIVSAWTALASSLLGAASVAAYFALSHRLLFDAIRDESRAPAGIQFGG